MTQDPYRQPPGTGYVVPGEVVPDDEANVTPPTAPMTHFQKVASALGGDRTDPAMPAYVSSDQGASPESPDPGANQAGQSSRDAQDDADRDATRPEEIIAVRSPDAGSRDYWDDADERGPDEEAPAAAAD